MTCGLDPESSALNARDLALILIGYAAALRRSDLARLDLDDLTIDEHGLSLRLRRSRIDQDNAGAVVGIAADETVPAPPLTSGRRGARTWPEPASPATPRGDPSTAPTRTHLTIPPARLSGRAINDIIARVEHRALYTRPCWLVTPDTRRVLAVLGAAWATRVIAREDNA
ncbi:hypothetical protein LQ327_30420 [Actinomycetospora endophytica]|uniref:Phage integrase family protein n=1 Tax=Actinomycetospora endophytica TaxID=2291215 RepID=A0ABS8PHH3_9PSEU|nr:hypothetical protein [Actinomycetospora endophytica]MCD2197695.1 hypothetical protein [Actinomycetospora endophytica]